MVYSSQSKKDLEAFPGWLETRFPDPVTNSLPQPAADSQAAGLFPDEHLPTDDDRDDDNDDDKSDEYSSTRDKIQRRRAIAAADEADKADIPNTDEAMPTADK